MFLRFIFRLLVAAALVALGFWLQPWLSGWLTPPAPAGPDPNQMLHQTLVTQVERMGKLELVKYRFTDVVTYKEKRAFYLFDLSDAQLQLLVAGEAVGCIDLARIGPEHVRVTADTVVVVLPTPEICYHKVDHAHSRILNPEESYWFTDKAKMIDAAYRKAERDVLTAALRTQILEQSKDNAERTLRPLLEATSDRRVVFTYEPLPVPLRPAY